jgi:hypothetical protein
MSPAAAADRADPARSRPARAAATSPPAAVGRSWLRLGRAPRGTADAGYPAGDRQTPGRARVRVGPLAAVWSAGGACSAAVHERCDHAGVVAVACDSAGMVGTANRDGPDPRRRPRRRRGARCMLSQQPHVGPGSAAGRGWLRAAGCRRPWLAACCWPAARNSRLRRVPNRRPPALARRWAAQQRRPRRNAAATPGATTPASAVRQAARCPPRYGGPCASHPDRSGVAVPGRPRHGGPSGGSCC